MSMTFENNVTNNHGKSRRRKDDEHQEIQKLTVDKMRPQNKPNRLIDFTTEVFDHDKI